MSQEQLIDLAPKQLGLLKKIIQQHIPDKTVWAYGSRVTWKADEASDIDLTVFDCTNVQIDELKETLEESNLPISVDVMNWEEIPDNFKTNIKKQYVVLQEKNTLEGWREVKLGDLIEVKHGYAFKGQYITSEVNNNILVTPGNFHIGGGFKSSKFKYFNGSIPQHSVLKEGDIVVTMTDLSKNGDTLGYSAKIPKSLTGEKYLHNQRVGLLQLNSKDVDLYYLYWLMRTHNYHWFVVGAASGTSIKHTSPTTIKEYKLSLPPLPEQKAIAEVLSSLDDKIDLLHRQNKTLENMAQTLFRQWFVEQADAEWEVGKIPDEFDFIMGQSPPGKSYNEEQNGIPMFQGNADFGFRFPANRIYTTQPKRFAEKYDTLISVRAPVGEQNMAKEKCCIGRGVATFRYKNNNSFYTYTYFKMMSLIKAIQQYNQTGTVFGSISKSDFQNMEIMVPPIKLIKKFQATAKPIDDKIVSNEAQINTLENLRDTLLPKLMSSEIKVNMDMKMNKKEYLKRRDNNRCGIHLGGCGEEFKPMDEITIDHMIPKSFKRESHSIFNQNYFLQPMHRHCNANIKRGQMTEYPTFYCNCHYSYFNIKEKNLEIFYKIKNNEKNLEIFYKPKNNEWRSEVFLKNIVSESGETVQLISGKQGDKIGFGRMSVDRTFGHMIPTISFKEKNKYYLRNFYSLLKCKRLDKAWEEEKLIDFKNCDKKEQSKIYLTLGDICADNNEHNKSMIYFDRAIEINPKLFEAYNSRGVLKGQLGQHREAIEDFKKVITLNPKHVIAYCNRGIAKSALGKPKEAIEDYDKAIKLNPQDADAYNNRGVAKSDLGKPEEAIDDYNKAIELNPKLAEAYNNRGVAKLALGRHEEVITDYDKAIELNPKHAKAYNNRGNAKLDSGKNEEAMEDYNETIKLNPQHPQIAEAYINRGVAKYRLEQHEEAIEDYTNAKTFYAEAGNMEMAETCEGVIAYLKRRRD